MLFKLTFRYKSNLNLRQYSKKVNNSNKLYSSTIFLPKTPFPLRLESQKLKERDENVYINAEFEQLYEWQRSHLSEPEFVLHDGPPYANGKLHMGHALNKILKDTILRYQMLKGNKVHFIPGWDCHGLPIELKALTKFDEAPLSIREKARHFARNTIDEQKNIFKSWGVTGDWKKHYATYSPDYVKLQIKIFNKLFQKKVIYRDLKPVYWSPSSRTALAEAELEYNQHHISKSVFVRFKLNKFGQKSSDRIYALIWTTTPWTLPANQTVCYNPSLSYILVKNSKDDSLYIIAEELLEQVAKSINTSLEKIENIPSEVFSQCSYTHPIFKEKEMRFLPGLHATAMKGTGLVHTAPAHGHDDFLIALNNKMKIDNLVDNSSCFNRKAGLELEGKFVLDEGNERVLELIRKDIVHLHDFKHSYPYDWRTNKPVIVRTSKQWFFDTESIKNRAMELLEDVKIVPKNSSDIYKKNLVGQLQKRPYWCISRQRKWGVPIPIFFNKSNGDVIINEDLVRHYYSLIDKNGTDFWWQLSNDQLIPDDLRKDVLLEDLEKGQDILDIWFDSGISWAYALDGDKVADMYLEGVDQFTGWFQSSLLTSVALRDKAPYKSIYVHGFVVDQKGLKMSKSVGNVIDPVEIVNGAENKTPFGIDTLRWWVACHANQDSMAYIGEHVLQSCTEELQKIRSVLRFALGALSDYNAEDLKYGKLSLLDKYLLHVLYKFQQQTNESLSNYQFHHICKCVINLLTNEVSALYYSAIKDRLYCDQLDSIDRRSCQYILTKIFETVTQAIAPIVPHLAEEMHQHSSQKSAKTYFTSSYTKPQEDWNNNSVENAMKTILNIKKDINKTNGNFTQNLCINIICPKRFHTLLEEVSDVHDIETELEDILQVSRVHLSIEEIKNDYQLQVTKSNLFSCGRCRRIQSLEENQLCSRCSDVVNKLSSQTLAV